VWCVVEYGMHFQRFWHTNAKVRKNEGFVFATIASKTVPRLVTFSTRQSTTVNAAVSDVHAGIK